MVVKITQFSGGKKLVLVVEKSKLKTYWLYNLKVCTFLIFHLLKN